MSSLKKINHWGKTVFNDYTMLYIKRDKSELIDLQFTINRKSYKNALNIDKYVFMFLDIVN